MANVLIVEDDAKTANLLSRSLSWYKHTVETCPSARISQAIVDNGFVPDVAVIDVGQRGIGGFQAAHELREHPLLNNAQIPIVMVAEDSNKSYVDSCRQLDAHLLQKPFSSATLQGAILAAIRHGKGWD